MKRTVIVLVGMVAIVAVSCDHNYYEIQMIPRGQVLERTLTVARIVEQSPSTAPATEPAPRDANEPTYGEVPAGEMAVMSKAYTRTQAPPHPKMHRFVGEFRGQTPNDVGGAGRYACYETAMGSAYAYVERFRGDDAPGENLEAVFRSTDRLTDLLVGWAKAQWGSRKDFEKLRRFLDEDVRKDIKNLGTYMVIMDAAKKTTIPAVHAEATEATRTEIIARLCQYLLERNYVDADDVPTILRAVNVDSDETRLPILGDLLRKILTKKAGIQDKDFMEELVGLVRKPDTVKESLEKHLSGTEDFKKLHARWEQKRKQDANALEPTGLEVLEDAAKPFTRLDVGIEIFGPTCDELEVSLKTGASPLWTNGNWDANTGKVTWKTRVRPRDDPKSNLPIMSFAVWTRPDEKFQKEHFGKVALTGQELVAYSLWRKSLDVKEAAEWDAMLTGLRPGPASLEKLKAFRFSSEPRPATSTVEPTTQPRTYAETGVEAILKGLESPKP